jgi:mannosyltransferase OCH1-like enzyme
MKIPRLLHQIWVGPRPAPVKWLATWRELHPQWQYRLWGNRELVTEPWVNERHIRDYYRRGRFNGVADLMRYEILYRFGGVVVAADSICLHPIDELFEDDFELYTINTGEYGGRRVAKNLGSTTPLYAATPGHAFTKSLIDALAGVARLASPPWSTGNRFMQRMLKRLKPDIQIWPMHFFIPEHFNGWRYTGPDRIYAKHFWGTTRGTYAQGA